MAFVELVAYADESGTHAGSGLTVMAGWVAYAERWHELEQKWRTMLVRNGLPFIHAIDLKQGKGQFKDKRKWPEPRRTALGGEASQLVVDHALFSLSVILRDRDY
jgi:hypothetical protein